jgi:hypothetical protein
MPNHSKHPSILYRPQTDQRVAHCSDSCEAICYGSPSYRGRSLSRASGPSMGASNEAPSSPSPERWSTILSRDFRDACCERTRQREWASLRSIIDPLNDRRIIPSIACRCLDKVGVDFVPVSAVPVYARSASYGKSRSHPDGTHYALGYDILMSVLSRDPPARMKALRRVCRFPIRYWFVLKGPLESEAHLRFG